MKSTKLFFPFFILLLASTTFAQTSVGLSSPTNKTLDVVVQNENGALSYIAWTGKAWSDWQALESPPNTNLSVQTISVESGRTEIIGVSDIGVVYHAFLKNNKLSEWQAINLQTNSYPEVVSWGKGRFDILTTNKKGEILQTYFSNGKWSKKWNNIGGDVRENQSPSVVAQAKGKLDIFYRSKESLIKHKSWNKNAWSDWETIPAMKLTSPVVAASVADGRLDLFTRGSKGELEYSVKALGRWGKWTAINKKGSVVNNGFVGERGKTGFVGERGSIHVHKRGEKLDIFYIERNSNNLMHATQTNRGRSEWQIVTPKANPKQLPSTTSWTSNRTDISFLNGKGELQQAYFNGKKWSSLRNKGKFIFIFPQKPVSVSPVSTPVFVPPRIKRIPLVDESEADSNNTSNDVEATTNIVNPNGLECITVTYSEAEKNVEKETITGPVPSGLVPGAIIQRRPFENYGLIKNAKVPRNPFEIIAIESDNAFNKILIDPDNYHYSYAEILEDIDRNWRKQSLNAYNSDPLWQYTKSYNLKESFFKLGISARYLVGNARFNLESRKYKHSIIHLLHVKSQYFTARAKLDDNHFEYLKNSEDATDKLLIKSVTYGRQLLIKIEEKVDSKSIDWEAGVSTDFGVFSSEASISSGLSRIKNEYQISVYALGGNETEGLRPLALMSGRIDDVKDLISEIERMTSFSSNNRGYPIHYTLENLENNEKLYFKYGISEKTEKIICIPRSTRYKIAIKAVKKNAEATMRDSGTRAEFTGSVDVSFENRPGTTQMPLGNLVQGDTELGANLVATNNIVVPGMMSVDLNSSDKWEYTPGYKMNNANRGNLPEISITPSTIKNNNKLNFSFNLREDDRDRGNADEKNLTHQETISIRELLGNNPKMHDIGAEIVVNFVGGARGRYRIDFLIEFIPMYSTVERFPIDNSGTRSYSRNSFASNSFNEYEENSSSSIQYRKNGEDLCLSSIEQGSVSDGNIPVMFKDDNTIIADMVPGAIFKIGDNDRIDYFNSSNLVRRTPLELAVENITSSGRPNDDWSPRKTITGINITNESIYNGIKDIFNTSVNLHATANSTVDVKFTHSAKTAMLSAGFSANSPFVNSSVSFFKESNSERLCYYAVISRDFFTVSARPLGSSWSTRRLSSSDPSLMNNGRSLSYDDQLKKEGYSYINEVTYGQRIIVRFEKRTKKKNMFFEADLDANIKQFSADIETSLGNESFSEDISIEVLPYGLNNHKQSFVMMPLDQEDIRELLGFFSQPDTENIEFNPRTGGFGKPVSFRAFTVGSDIPLIYRDIMRDYQTTYACINVDDVRSIRINRIKSYGIWSDYGNTKEIKGKITSVFFLDGGRIWWPSQKLFDTQGTDHMESLSLPNTNGFVPFKTEESTSLMDLRGRFSEQDIINGKMYLQFEINEHEKPNQNGDDKFHHISEPIPLYELLSDEGAIVDMPVSNNKGLMFKIIRVD